MEGVRNPDDLLPEARRHAEILASRPISKPDGGESRRSSSRPARGSPQRPPEKSHTSRSCSALRPTPMPWPHSPRTATPLDQLMASRPDSGEIAALLEPIVTRRIPGAADARIANWTSAERGLSTGDVPVRPTPRRPGRPTTLRRLVFRRPPAVSLYFGLRPATPGSCDETVERNGDQGGRPCAGWIETTQDLGTPYYVMEQLPTIGTANDFPSYHSQGCISTPHPPAGDHVVGLCADDRRCARIGMARPQNWTSYWRRTAARVPLEQVVAYCDELLMWASPPAGARSSEMPWSGCATTSMSRTPRALLG